MRIRLEGQDGWWIPQPAKGSDPSLNAAYGEAHSSAVEAACNISTVKLPKYEWGAFKRQPFPALSDFINASKPANCVSGISSQYLSRKGTTSCSLLWHFYHFRKVIDIRGASLLYAGGIDHVRVHPKFLHSNATSHRWALGGTSPSQCVDTWG